MLRRVKEKCLQGRRCLIHRRTRTAVADAAFGVFWLLLILVPLTMWVPLYNRVEPTFAGFPFFYWFQLLTIIIGAALAALAYFVTNDE